MSGAQSPSTAEPRTSRRRRRTRARLLKAALRLMAERGVEGVAIQEITDAADVGFGTFYNYFESKEAIYDALIEEVIEGFGDVLDRIAEHVDDPAEVMAASVRYSIEHAYRAPLWGAFLVQSGFSGRALERGLGPRMVRDLRRGIEAGRFIVPELAATIVAVRGAVLSAIDAQVELSRGADGEPGFAASLGVDAEALPSQGAAMLLRLLGLDADDAREVAHRPLPDVGLDQESDAWFEG